MSGDHEDASISRRVRRLETLLEEKGIVPGGAVDEVLDAFLSGASPVNGARVVAHAWTDEAYRARLLTDGTAAVQELGFMDGSFQRLRVVENTDATHNVIVCTLCSCYPLPLLGPSPGWYKSEAYRSRVVREPRSVLAEFGLTLPTTTDITVWDSSAETRYMVLPLRPAGTESLTEDELAALVTRNALIGTAAV
ncbi:MULTISPECIES: nitrile hydratase subunit alpha [unclassified Streptomyces]|uniref:nitrile hydratase subunit alpha n=1 Tax=unclassified Streptomyces TaxID=2593676 RepID=UPI00190D5FAC|nr:MULTISPECIES: nitrile hydratase subunit alpha [unclassified Streptomyces]MBK3568384.1 nitrile hydratase subunit alpha [Streptomyces sp. MBT62]MBK6014117.1 nitrile hydratase subunit alpha [Streptomyces sp. MBT53]